MFVHFSLNTNISCALRCKKIQITNIEFLEMRPNKKICVFMVTCQKNLGSVGINFLIFFLSAKPEIVVPGSGIRLRYFIFKISGKPSFVEAVL